MINNVDKQYLELLQYILVNGEEKGDRTGTGTTSIFDYSMTFDMAEGFPLLTSKKVFTKAVIHELIWFLNGDTNIKYLVDNGVNIWNGDAFKNYMKNSSEFKGDWPDNIIDFVERIKSDNKFAKKWGELGPVYGKQWRNWKGYKKVANGWEYGAVTGWKDVRQVDQISDLINDLKNNPDSRRLMVSAWNPAEIDQMVLPPCHYGFQCYTNKMNLDERKEWWCKSIGKTLLYSEDMTDELLDDMKVPTRKLSLKWNQRSCDVPLGIPFNIASYAILLHLLSKEVNMVPHLLKFSGGDCHIYSNQMDGVKEQLLSEVYDLPKIELSNDSLDSLKYEDIKITGYSDEIKSIKFPLSN
jgi:thymidylate synthase